MSTREYLSKLDINQLMFAREEAERLIKEKKDPKKVTLIIVEGKCEYELNQSYDVFHLAKLKKCELKPCELIVQKEDFTQVHLGSFHPKISKVMKLNAS